MTDERDGHETEYDAEYVAAWREWLTYQRTTGRYLIPVNDLSMFYHLRQNGDPLE